MHTYRRKKEACAALRQRLRERCGPELCRGEGLTGRLGAAEDVITVRSAHAHCGWPRLISP